MGSCETEKSAIREQVTFIVGRREPVNTLQGPSMGVDFTISDSSVTTDTCIANSPDMLDGSLESLSAVRPRPSTKRRFFLREK